MVEKDSSVRAIELGRVRETGGINYIKLTKNRIIIIFRKNNLTKHASTYAGPQQTVITIPR